ncbi:MAG: Fe-S oxidoreductase [Flavobacteriaceae bacterium]|nr:Fe-S oxidoreductase [Flavobacteriaceae bacterium]
MTYIPNIIFTSLLIFSIWFFRRNVLLLKRNILLGRDIDRSDQKKKRWLKMLRVSVGQSKMINRPIAGIFHVVIYAGFIIMNIELLEIITDGILGTHRVFASSLGSFYSFIISVFEIFAALIILAVVVFWARRNILKLKRFLKPEMGGWPKKDANLILYFELILMTLFLLMNVTDSLLQNADYPGYIKAGAFPVSSFLIPLFDSFNVESLFILERIFWWSHIIGIFIFLNYLYYSKHLHIILAFPNTYFSNLKPNGYMKNNELVTREVKLMLDPNANQYESNSPGEITDKFGASDANDLTWIQLLNAYTCTECGRCTAECPANQTGKKLSPRKIMMDTRDRIEEIGRNINGKGKINNDGKQLIGDYISHEEIWACTSCNACVEACPIDIDPLSIIMDLRQYLVMENSAAPNDLNNMIGNIENNGAPWPFSNQDRVLWAKEN